MRLTRNISNLCFSICRIYGIPSRIMTIFRWRVSWMCWSRFWLLLFALNSPRSACTTKTQISFLSYVYILILCSCEFTRLLIWKHQNIRYSKGLQIMRFFALPWIDCVSFLFYLFLSCAWITESVSKQAYYLVMHGHFVC